MSTHPDPAPWRMSHDDDMRLRADIAAGSGWPSDAETVERAVALGIVPHPEQHGLDKCVPLDGRIACSEPYHLPCGFPDSGDCYRHGPLHGIGKCTPVSEASLREQAMKRRALDDQARERMARAIYELRIDLSLKFPWPTLSEKSRVKWLNAADTVYAALAAQNGSTDV
jgi:hypothetical protein